MWNNRTGIYERGRDLDVKAAIIRSSDKSLGKWGGDLLTTSALDFLVWLRRVLLP